MNNQATNAFYTLLNTLCYFWEHGASGYPTNHPHAKLGYWPDHPLAKRRTPPEPATLENALVLVRSADFILAARESRGQFHSLLDVIERQRAELVECMDAVEAKPDTVVAAGRRSA